MSRTLSNTTASRNGRSVEVSILRYLGLPHEQTPVDTTLEGSPLEIKSCQVLVGDCSHLNNRRSGRFVLEEEQHRHLVENNGRYVFVVHEEGIVHHTRMLRADLLPVREFRGIRSLPWPTVMGVNT